MAKGLKGITVTIDGNTTPLNKALSTVNANARSLQTELKGVNSLLKLDPNNTELVAQKQLILSKAIDETEEKMKMLTQAEKEMAAAGKDINDDAYRSLQREIVLTRTKLQELKQEKSTFDELSKTTKTFGQSLAETAQKVPIVKNLAQAFTNVKEKIGSAVKENEQIKKISQYTEEAKQKVTSFAEKVPAVKKVGEAFGSIKDKVNDLSSKLPSVTEALKNAGSAAATMTANVAKVGFKAIGAAAAGAAAAVGGLTTAAMQGYAQFEQLAGGVETLFKTSEDTVMNYAEKAYKTAGMSANQYMETVTSFSAALIQSLDGDTEKAAQKADMAITDMADNANKMGSSIETLQTAYSGFAKGNFTLLDNLKLGYGGTKEEMQRLLDDAEAISGIKYDMSSYADVVDAIHVIQTEMGITGTTAKEASETIQGSVDSAGAAWQNWLTGMADDDADFEQLTEDLVDSIMTVIENIVPRILTTIPRIVEGLSQLISQLGGYVPDLIQSLLPSLLSGITDLLNALMTTLPEMLGILSVLVPQIVTTIAEIVPQVISVIATLIPQIISTIAEMLPDILTAGIEILTSLIQGIIDAIPVLIQTVVDLFPIIVSAILENLPKIIEMGLELLVSLINGIVQAIPQLVAMLPTIITTIVNTLITMLPQILQTGITLLTTLIKGIVETIPQLVEMLPEIITSIVDTLVENLPQILQTGIELLGALISGILEAIPELIEAMPEVISAIWDTLKEVDWLELGKNIIDGIIEGVSNAAASLLEVFKDIAASALNEVKEFFGIASPSKVMRDEVGKMIPAGMAIGVEEGMDDEEDRIQEAMRKGVPTTIDSYINAKAGTYRTEAGATTAGGFTQNVTINSPKQLEPSEVARQLRNQTRQVVLKMKTG